MGAHWWPPQENGGKRRERPHPWMRPPTVSGVLAVAGLRNVGTKVGYSSLGPEVGVSAPAGNCVKYAAACLALIRSTRRPSISGSDDARRQRSTRTKAIAPNLGTSFSAPIVSGIAASLMRAVNANLTPPQLIARIKSSANPVSGKLSRPVYLPVCPDPTIRRVESRRSAPAFQRWHPMRRGHGQCAERRQRRAKPQSDCGDIRRRGRRQSGSV